jgi:hypothetical protein
LGNEAGFTFVIISKRKPIRMKTNFFNLFRLIILGTGCTFLLSCSNQGLLSPYVTDTPVRSITVNQAQQLQKNFHDLKLCDPESKDIDLTNNAWISMESLANYLNYALSNPPGGLTADKISGLRIYFGRYPYTIAPSGQSPSFEGNDRLTVFIVPTVKDNGSDRHNDADLNFAILNYGNAGQPPRKTIPHN